MLLGRNRVSFLVPLRTDLCFCTRSSLSRYNYPSVLIDHSWEILGLILVTCYLTPADFALSWMSLSFRSSYNPTKLLHSYPKNIRLLLLPNGSFLRLVYLLVTSPLGFVVLLALLFVTILLLGVLSCLSVLIDTFFLRMLVYVLLVPTLP